jgi:hypothetical protein
MSDPISTANLYEVSNAKMEDNANYVAEAAPIEGDHAVQTTSTGRSTAP